TGHRRQERGQKSLAPGPGLHFDPLPGGMRRDINDRGELQPRVKIAPSPPAVLLVSPPPFYIAKKPTPNTQVPLTRSAPPIMKFVAAPVESARLSAFSCSPLQRISNERPLAYQSRRSLDVASPCRLDLECHSDR